MNMFKTSHATSVDEYLDQVSESHKDVYSFLHALIQKETGFLPFFANNMIGYGSFDYVDSKKQTQKWPIIALADQKNYVSIYVCALDNGEYIAEKHKEKLGKVSIGKSCIRVKKRNDINIEALKKVLHFAKENPGLR